MFRGKEKLFFACTENKKWNMNKIKSSFILIPLILITQMISCGGGGGGGIASAGVTGMPNVLYTDILSGPNTGGENNKGVYLSIFGKNFGESGLGTTVKVYINNVEVDNYRYLGASKGRPDIQQITVQVGSIGNPTPGVALPIKVVVGGAASNTDHAFMVQPGNIYFVSTSGNDSTGVKNDITHPYQHPQYNTSAGALGAMTAGDVMVVRGGTYTGAGWGSGGSSYFMRFHRVAGNAPTGAVGHGPITVMGYPGEDAFFHPTGTTGSISGANGQSYPTYGKWVVLSNLRVDAASGGNDGPINLQIYSNYWRIVNNDISSPATAGNEPLSGGVSGNGGYVYILGNKFHDIAGSGETTHGIYIDGGNDVAGPVEIAYNYIYNISGGCSIQQYNNGSNGAYNVTNDFIVHHNLLVNNTKKHGLNIADGSGSGFRIYNNVISGVSRNCVRFNSTNLSGLRMYNNTFYNCGTDGTGRDVLLNEWSAISSSNADIRNNIFWVTTGGSYLGGTFNSGVFANNLWYNAGTGPAGDTTKVSANPLFVSNGSDFHLQAGSPAINSGTASLVFSIVDDFDIMSRPQGTGSEIGAFEFPVVGSTKVPNSPPIQQVN